MRTFIEKTTGPIPDPDWKLYESHLKPTKAEKGETILALNKPCKTIWHMTKGAVRKIEMDKGIERTTHFFIAPEVFSVLHSTLTGVQSDFCIICEEDCEFLELNTDSLQGLYQQSIYIERIGRRMVEEVFIQEFNIRRMFLKLDALQRYEYMEYNHPEIIRRFQLKDVATFLGVTPETLSRLRRTRLSD